jgi:hypothetical protein
VQSAAPLVREDAKIKEEGSRRRGLEEAAEGVGE